MALLKPSLTITLAFSRAFDLAISKSFEDEVQQPYNFLTDDLYFPHTL